jgi:hypothetical protein
LSLQRLSDRSRRRIERGIGLSIVRAWSFGQYNVYLFVIADESVEDLHRHGVYNRKDESYQLIDVDDVTHITTCAELFPGFDPAAAFRRSQAARLAREVHSTEGTS